MSRFELPGGARLVVVEDPGATVVAMRAAWPGGTRTDGDGPGAEVLAAALTRGCARREAGAIDRALDDAAATLVGYAERDSLGLRGQAPRASFGPAFALLLDCVVAPHLDRQALRAADRDLAAARAARAGSAGDVFDLLVSALEPAAGGGDDRTRRPDDSARADFRHRYPPSGLTLVVVGAVRARAVVAAAAPRLRAVAAAARPPAVAPARPVARAREVFRYTGRDRVHLAVGFPGAGCHSADRFVLDVIAAVLDGPGGRLDHRLRGASPLADRVAAVALESGAAGLIAIYLATAPARLAAAERAVAEELARLRSAPPSAAELARARQRLTARHRAALRHPAGRAALHLEHELCRRGGDPVAALPAGLAAVTARDVVAAAQRFLGPDRQITATVRPLELTPGAARRAHGKVARAPRRRR